MIFNCPGSTKFKHPEPQSVSCSSCGRELEIWTDEIECVCRDCNVTVKKKAGQSCLDWCRYAKICAGYKIIAEKQGRI